MTPQKSVEETATIFKAPILPFFGTETSFEHGRFDGSSLFHMTDAKINNDGALYGRIVANFLNRITPLQQYEARRAIDEIMSRVELNK